MKAIHNCLGVLAMFLNAVNYTQRYKKWKQFTTVMYIPFIFLVLWTIHKDTKNESNSQRIWWRVYAPSAVNYTQRYKKWKQFTTWRDDGSLDMGLWTIHKDTKNESNSQRLRSLLDPRCGCELYTKIQKMKAIHNCAASATRAPSAVNYTQRYKKWKQFTTFLIAIIEHGKLWTIHKDTKNESNSQQLAKYSFDRSSCELYTKIQKMKAIHNKWGVPTF